LGPLCSPPTRWGLPLRLFPKDGLKLRPGRVCRAVASLEDSPSRGSSHLSCDQGCPDWLGMDTSQPIRLYANPWLEPLTTSRPREAVSHFSKSDDPGPSVHTQEKCAGQDRRPDRHPARIACRSTD
jgi:hypothetical protein